MMKLSEFKSTMRDLEVRGVAQAATIASAGMNPVQSKTTKRFMSILLAVTLLCAMAVPGFAASEFTTKVDNAKTQIMDFLTGAIVSIGVVSLGVCGVVLIFGIGGQRASENAKAWIFRIVIGMALVLMAGPIIDAVKGFFDSTGGTP